MGNVKKKVVTKNNPLNAPKKSIDNKLNDIIDKYKNIEFNKNNYDVGSGLVSGKFASNRHEDAKNDEGKLTLGEATLFFKKATELETSFIKKIIEFVIPNMEWHHAGKLPKSYGGGMKKTYFLNSKQILDLASNWKIYIEKYEKNNLDKKNDLILEQKKQEKRKIFLEKFATKRVRINFQPPFFYETDREMNGKYGWFTSYHQSYNLPEYYTGYEFKSKKDYDKFLKL